MLAVIIIITIIINTFFINEFNKNVYWTTVLEVDK